MTATEAPTDATHDPTLEECGLSFLTGVTFQDEAYFHRVTTKLRHEDPVHWVEHEDHEHGHRHFEAQLRAFRERLDGGDSTLARDVMRFLIAWLAEHILEDDMAYSAHLRAHGVR